MLTSASPQGVVTVPSPYSATRTLARLSAAAKAKNLLVFATIDFSRDAASAGLLMNDS